MRFRAGRPRVPHAVLVEPVETQRLDEPRCARSGRYQDYRVGHAQKTPLKGMRFQSLEQAQTYLDRWGERCADTRIHSTTKRQVAAMFAEERTALLPQPLEPFRYYQFGESTVH